MASSRNAWLLLVFGGLVAATIASWIVGADHVLGDAGNVSLAASLAIGFIKVRFVGMAFMELDGAPVLLRRIFDGWVAVVGTVLLMLLLTA